MRDLGADEALDYRTTEPSDIGPFDVVVDTVGTALLDWRGRVAAGGRFVTITLDFAHPVRTMAALVGSVIHGSGRIRMLVAPPRSDTMAELTRVVEGGDLRPVIDSTFRLEDIADAHARAGKPGLVGKVVIAIDD